MLLEKVSEKPRRGRPRTTARNMAERISRDLCPDAQSERAKVDAVYRTVALSALVDDKTRKYDWICDTEKMRAGKGGFKQTIVAHLGRIVDPEAIRDAAAYVNDRQLRTQDAIRFIREYRGVAKRKQLDCLELTEQLLRVCGEYWKSFPELGTGFFVTALENAIAELTGISNEEAGNGG
jgi:hypothetical protein